MEAMAEIADPALAEAWDNPGLQVGDPDAPVNHLMFALDVTEDLYEDAVAHKVQMIVSHHPPLFNPLKSLDFSSPVPRLLLPFIRSGIAIASAHTNLDSAAGGVSDVLADMAGLLNRKPVFPSSEGDGAGLGRIGELPGPELARNFLERFCDSLKVDSVMVAGNLEKQIRRVALCGGSGSGLWPAVLSLDCDMFITGEVKHNVAVEAVMFNRIVVDAGHWATEHPVVSVMYERFCGLASRKRWNVDISVFEGERPPLSMWHK
jgi:dinuclear metal center YbgI/SA1388 family protein